MISYHFINPFKCVSVWHYCDRLMLLFRNTILKCVLRSMGKSNGDLGRVKIHNILFCGNKIPNHSETVTNKFFLSYTTNAHISLLSKDFHYPKNVKFRITRKLFILPKDKISCYEMKQNLKKQQQWRHGRTWRVMIKTLNMNVVQLWDVVSVAADSNKWRHVSEICSTG